MNNISKIILSLALFGVGGDTASADPTVSSLFIKNQSKYPVIILEAYSKGVPRNEKSRCKITDLARLKEEINNGVFGILKSTVFDPKDVNKKITKVVDNALDSYACYTAEPITLKGGAEGEYGEFITDKPYVLIAFKDFDNTYQTKRINPTPVVFNAVAYPVSQKRKTILATKKSDKCLFGVWKICDDDGLEVKY